MKSHTNFVIYGLINATGQLIGKLSKREVFLIASTVCDKYQSTSKHSQDKHLCQTHQK